MKEIDDETLMMQYAKGDVQAFTRLYYRHKDSLYRYFLRQTASPEVAEELYQEVWGKLIKAHLDYSATSKFTTWLYRIAHNQLVDHYRHNSTATKIITASIDEPSEELTKSIDLSDPQSNLLESLSQSQQMQQLKQCLQQLPRAQKEAFLLKHESGLSLKEIAQVINETTENIKSRLRYGLSKLKHCLRLNGESK